VSPPRVCRALRAVAEALLYRHIVIKDVRASNMSLLQCSLSTKRWPNGVPAGAWTRKITVTALTPHTLDLNAPHIRGLREVILLCPNLESFCICGRPPTPIGYPETTEGILDALPDHLRMCASADTGETVLLSFFRDSCSFFSRLEHLRLRRIWSYGSDELILTLPSLRSLSFASWITIEGIDQWDLPSLVWLEISVESPVWLEELDSFFSKHGKKLEFLQLVPGDLNQTGGHRLYYIEIPLSFFRYFPLLSCFSVDPSWMQLDTIEESDEKGAVPHENLTTLHILRPDPRHGPHKSCSEFVRSFFVAHHKRFPNIMVISFIIDEEYIVVPMFYPWFCSSFRPTREELVVLGDGFSLVSIDRAYS
jgi:hypothetical protein